METYKRLTVYAHGLTKNVPDVFDGVSAADLVNETMLTFLKSSDALGWEPRRGDLSTFLSGVLHHKFLDHLKRHRRRAAGSIDDPAFCAEGEPESRTADSVLDRLDARRRIDEMIARLTPHKELQDVLETAAAAEGDYGSNRRIAEELQTTPGKVANLKKRILRILLGGSR